MKKFILATIIAFITAIGSVGSFDSVSVAANAEGTATSTETEYAGIITVAKSQYFAKSEKQVSNYRFKKDFAISEDVTAVVSVDKTPADKTVSVDSADTASARKDEDSSHGRSHNRYWAKESFTVNNRKGVIDDTVTSSDTANSADQR